MAAYAPYILMAAGTAASIAGQQSQAREQRRIINRAMDDTAKTQKEGAQMVLDQAAKLSPQQRQQALADQENATYSQAQQDLSGRMDAGGTGAIIDTAGSPGAVSQDFVKAKADKAISEGTRLMEVAREAAKTRAPGQLLTSEGQQVADLMGRLGSKYGANKNMSQAATLDAQNVDTPLYGKLGKIASMVGSIWAGGQMAAGGAGAGAGSYSLAGNGAQLGEASAPSFWSSAGSRIRFAAPG